MNDLAKDLYGEHFPQEIDMDKFWEVAENGLNSRVLAIMKARYNYDGSLSGHTYDDIRKQLDLSSRERVRQGLATGMRYMRHQDSRKRFENDVCPRCGRPYN